MKKFFACLAISFCLASCGVTIKSVVDHSAIKEPYKNPLVVIPYQEGAIKNFCEKLKENLETRFQNDSKKVEVILFRKEEKDLSLNTTSSIDEKINSSIKEDNKDLMIIFSPTHYEYSNGGLTGSTYRITAIDVSTHKEVWKAEMTSNGSFGIGTLADKAAETIYGRLIGEGVI